MRSLPSSTESIKQLMIEKGCMEHAENLDFGWVRPFYPKIVTHTSLS